MIQKRIVVVGDLVECIYKGDYYSQFHEGGLYSQFHEGGLYRVTDVYQDHGELRYSFACDDQGSKTNGWGAEYFRLAPEQSPMSQGEYEAILADQDAYEALKEG